MQTITTAKHSIYLGENSLEGLSETLHGHSSIFILVDENTKKKCLPLLKRSLSVPTPLTVIQIKSGEKNKNIRTCEKIWKELSKSNADRKSILINLGGGVITDIGAFAASTYKRGIGFINIPTTLLAQADASIGGKTGIDFLNFKNQIGTFAFPKAVFINPDFLKTLNKRELLSGFAEVIKHGLIADKNYWRKIQSTDTGLSPHVSHLLFSSIEIKNRIVTEDPYEKGIRKALNFGHTIGHAVESASLKGKNRLLHGEAIAIGMICEAYMSRKCCGLSDEELESITGFIISAFGPKPVKTAIKRLLSFMQQDKKNKDAEINFTLLSSIGSVQTDCSCSNELIEESLLYFNSNTK